MLGKVKQTIDVYRLHQKRLCYWLLFIGAEISLINITSQSKHAIPCYSVSQRGTDVTLYFALHNIIIYIFFNSTVLVNWAIENTAYRLCVGWIPSKLNHLSEGEPTKSAFDARRRCKDRNASTCQFNAIIQIRIQGKSSPLFLHQHGVSLVEH